MKVLSLWAGTAETSLGINPELAKAAAIVNDESGAHSDSQKFDAYQTAASLWNRPGNSASDRALLVNAVTQSPFAHRVQSTLDTFSRAAWAGQDASAVERRQKMLDAFDGLEGFDQKIVAGQLTVQGKPVFASPDEFRANLQAEVDLSKVIERAVSEKTYAVGQDPATITDSTLSTAVKLAATARPPSNAWTEQVQSLLGNIARQGDRVTLSAEAKAAMVAGAPPEATAEEPVNAAPEVAAAIRAYRKAG